MKRRLEIGRLLMKYGRQDLVQIVGLDEGALRDEADVPTGADPDELARDLEGMGATFIKGGQLLSTRPDLLAQPYIDSLARLQDNVEPVTFGDVERIVESELGVRLSKGFASFELSPLGAASLSQVHRARFEMDAKSLSKCSAPVSEKRSWRTCRSSAD